MLAFLSGGSPMASSADVLFWRDSGRRERPAVVCLHGQFLDGRSYDALSARLASSWRVLVPDLPGYGKSPLPSPYSLEGVRSAIEQDLDARGIGEVAVVGWSIGCYHALALALAGRVRVSRMVLLGPIAGADAETRSVFAGYARSVVAGMDFVEAMMGLALPAGWADAHPAEAALLRARIGEASRATLATELDAVARIADLRPRLHEIRTPTLVRVGDADRNTPVAWAEQIAGTIPGAILQVVPGAGHLYLVQDAEATETSLIRFLS